ncbi:Uncharacterized protein FWK35_00029751 [Aphis craccivora]|uniref:Uncharacterized protein n=1 Tax=Aphis craccivora TaxID=307492 RepID=A0A6G0W2D5_APHCR|nr:Uncharacterized protein FWK35_00029751 [Aphis craccivora]
MQNLKKIGTIRKVTSKKPKDCIRINKTEGGKFCIKIPTSKTGSDYVVVTKYKTTHMDKKTSTFTAETFVDENVKIDNAILVAFNHLQDLLMEKFMTNYNKKIESYKSLPFYQ